MRDDETLDQRYRERLDQLDRDKVLDWMLSSVVSRLSVRFAHLRRAAEDDDRPRDETPESVRDARSRLSRDRRRHVEAAVDSFIRSTDERILSEIAELSLDETSEQPPIVFHDETNSLAVLMLLGADRLAELARPLEMAVSSGAELQLALSYLGWRSAQRAPSAILDACIPAAVAEFETLLAALLRIAQMVHPEGLGVGNKATTIAEVEAAGGIELARARAVDSAARAIVDSSPLDWRKRLAKWPGVDPAEFVPSWDAVAEIFDRRNALVHAGGRVDETYRKHQSLRDEGPPLGKPLHCSQEYVLLALDTLYAVARGLAGRWLPKLRPDASFEPYGDDESVLYLLSYERWELAATLSNAFLEHTGADDVMRVNNWMARRELATSTDVIRSEVEAWEAPDDHVRWRIARAALLERPALVRSLLDQEDAQELTAECASWPLLKRLRRADPQLDVWLAKNARQHRRKR